MLFECVAEYDDDNGAWHAHSIIAYNNSDNIYEAYFIDTSTQKILNEANSTRILPHTGYDTIGNSTTIYIGNTTDNIVPEIIVRQVGQ